MYLVECKLSLLSSANCNHRKEMNYEATDISNSWCICCKRDVLTYSPVCVYAQKRIIVDLCIKPKNTLGTFGSKK